MLAAADRRRPSPPGGQNLVWRLVAAHMVARDLEELLDTLAAQPLVPPRPPSPLHPPGGGGPGGKPHAREWGGGCVQIQCSEAIEAIKLLRGPPRRGVADLEAAVAGRPAPPAGNADERRQLLEAQALLDAQKVTRPRCLRARPPPSSPY